MRTPKRFVESNKYQHLENEWKDIKVNKLTILSFPGYKDRSDGGSDTPVVHVKCDCGKEAYMDYYHVRNGRAPSCGCIHSCYRDPGEASKYDLMGRYKHSAKKRNFPFTLSFDEFKDFIKENCHYCGIEPLQKRTVKDCKGEFLYNGIDRVNSERGYELDNCVTCCFTCNRAKSKMPYEKFIQYIQRFANREIIYDSQS